MTKQVGNLKYTLFIFRSVLIVFSPFLMVYAEIPPVNERTPQVRDAITAAAGVTSATDVTETDLGAITSLNLRSKGITALKSGDFSGMSGLTNLNLYNNELSSLPDGIFEGLTALTSIRLGGNTVNPLPITVSLERVGDSGGQFKAVVPTGAPFDIVVPISAVNGNIADSATTLTIAKGSVESDALMVTRTAGTTDAVTANIGTLPSLPGNHYGYTLSKSDTLPLSVINTVVVDGRSISAIVATEAVVNTPPVETPAAPVFTDGAIAIRSVVENTGSDVNIGAAIVATDANDDSLTYTLRGTDAAAFEIDSATGQLKTSASLDYEIKRIYTVAVTVSDGSLIDTITVIVNVIDVADTDLAATSLPVSERTPQVRDAIVAAVSGITSAEEVTGAHLAGITSLNLRSAGISELKSGDFAGLTGLTSLNLYGNLLSILPNGIFEGLISLTTLRLGGNTFAPMPLLVSLQQVSDNQFQAVISTGAPFDIVLPINDSMMVTIQKGSVTSASFTYVGTPSIGELPVLPAIHFGYILAKSDVCNRTFQVIEAITDAVPGETDCRNVSEIHLATITTLNLSGTSITSLDASDFSGLLSLTTLNLSNNQLTNLPNGIFVGLTSLIHLSLSGNSVSSIPLTVTLEKVGENQVRAVVPAGAPFDMVLKVSVENGSLGVDNIMISKGSVVSVPFPVSRTAGTTDAVTVDIKQEPSLPATHSGYTLVKPEGLPLEIFKRINVAPVFTDGSSTTRVIAENTATGIDISTAITATDANDDTLTYSLGGTDASSFAIDTATGQLKTKASLDYETKNSYLVTVSVSDGTLTDVITVTINVTDVDENRAPVFTEGTSTTRSIAERTAAGENIGEPVAATDMNADPLIYSIGGADASSFAIDTATGQLKTKASLDYETKNSYSVTITVTDRTLTDFINVTINVTDVDEKPVTDSRITTGEPETTSTNNAPEFTDGDSTTRSVAENTGAGVDIGKAVSATDTDRHTLTYTLGGPNKGSFSIDSTTGQLRTDASLDYETKSSYSVTITVSDGNDGTDSISVTINVTDVDETPTNNVPLFSDGESTIRSITENTGSGVNIGTAVSATDTDGDTLTYTLSGTDAGAFSLDSSSSGQLRTSASLDYETKSSYSVTISVSDGNGGSDSITVTIIITNVDETPTNTAPEFTAGSSETLTVTENTGSGVDIGDAVAATDADNDTLSYSLDGTDADSFSIDSSSGQLRTSASLDYETKSSYSVTISVSDGNSGSDSITITINITDVDETPTNTAPEFTAGSSETLTVTENTGLGVDIGDAVAATDADNDTLSYSLDGTDADSFSIDSSSGQLRTSASLDYETKSSYSVTISVSDDNGGTDDISVMIKVTDVNEAPAFSDGDSTTRSIAENVAANINIGSAVSAVDPEDSKLTYTLVGTDTTSFSLDSTTGQLKTKVKLDYESKKVYSVTITVSDGSLTDSITVTINVTNLDETPSNNPPVFTDGTSTTRSIAENTAADENIGTPIAATDADNNRLAYLLSGTDASSFSIDDTNGQLKTNADLNHETKSSYTVVVTVTDGSDTDTITGTINVTDVNEAPVITANTDTTLSIAENTAAGVNIGATVSATDPDDGDTLTYSLGGADASSFHIVSTSGQLQTKAALDYESKTSYIVTITVSDTTLTDTIDITINVSDVDENRTPVFTDGDSTTRSVAENTGSGVNIGSAVAATDADNDELVYILSGTDEDSFSINSTNGQLRTKAALDYETKTFYSVTITVSDGNGKSDSITVTVSVTDVDDNRAPEFTDGDSTTRSIAEDTAADMDIGDPVAARDADDDVLTYVLGGTDADSFSIVSTTGQLQTKAPLNYEQKDTYFVTVTVSDENGGSDSIVVTISIIGAIISLQQQVINSAPTFTDGDSTTRSVVENTESGQNIGDPVAATDADNDTLTYTLSGTDATSFSIVNTSGQLQTNTALDYEVRTSYSVAITVSDGNEGSDSITVTISVTDVTEITITPVRERTPQIRDGIVAAAGVDSADDVTPEHLAAITSLDLQSKGITSLKTGDFDGLISLKWLSFRFNNLTDISPLANLTQLTNLSLYHINIIDISPLENLTELKSLDLANNKIVDISALDDLTKLTFLKLNRNRISDISALDDLTKLSHLNLSNNNNISDISALDGMTALTTLEIANNNISDISALEDMTALTSLSLGENSISDISHLQNMTALRLLSLEDNNISDISSLTNITGLIRLILGHNNISDISTLEDMTALTALNLNNNNISDISALDDLTKLASLSLSENSISDISAMDDLTALTSLNLINNSISDISALDDMTNMQSLYLANNNISDISYLEGFTMLTYLTLHGNPITDFGSIATILDNDTGITIASYIGNRYPRFIDGNRTTRSVAENTEPGQNIGQRISAKDPDGDAFSYYLRGTDAASFSIVSTTGQLQTKDTLDYETKSSYSVTVYVIDVKTKNGKIAVTINVTDVDGAAPSVQASPEIPDNTALLSNFPNPFNPETWIPYQLANASNVQITIYDARGVIVRRLDLEHQRAGYYITRSSAAHWNGRNNLGERVANGFYFYHLQVDSVSFLRKMVILK